MNVYLIKPLALNLQKTSETEEHVKQHEGMQSRLTVGNYESDKLLLQQKFYDDSKDDRKRGKENLLIK